MSTQLRDEIEFKGVVYTRFPDHVKKNQRNYYYAPRGSGKGLLHREIWKASYGDIPLGHDIHHIDENPLNNNLDDLVPLTKKQHAQMHAAEYAEVRREWINSIRPLASEWHGSSEGIEWHRTHAKEVWSHRERDKETTCGSCGTPIKMFQHGNNPDGLSFCSRNCIMRHRRKKKLDMREGVCPICAKLFLQGRGGRGLVLCFLTPGVCQ